ncbi:hypothetical protein QWY86_06310 [Pedobacter aquatilis]|uniref:hypothetical protein n=1 Tax=Pedobacter aquatilis TaxID=351343 RepID=UPI0025B2AA5B|nr:hypothetical protein [Pedobacter aquatilis]MDN3586272.1 hypothetical protein [Pedobacter aquatilis]
MKKLLFICLMAVVAWGCKSVSYYEPRFTIGMSETDFKQENPKSLLVSSADDNTKIYRTTYNGWRPVPEPYSFFYFHNGKLTKFVKSDRLDDYKFMQ